MSVCPVLRSVRCVYAGRVLVCNIIADSGPECFALFSQTVAHFPHDGKVTHGGVPHAVRRSIHGSYGETTTEIVMVFRL